MTLTSGGSCGLCWIIGNYWELLGIPYESRRSA
uniref:Uncharacterized protein n=1 Tax=Eubacterium cellulosolvens (strain ATCC 43171 / JCM 9499 / 6) TaxID=633697 RepID=I5ATQ8_EUBC6